MVSKVSLLGQEMLKLFTSHPVIGLEQTPHLIKGAQVQIKNGTPWVEQLYSIPLPLESTGSVKPLYMKGALLITGLPARDVLIRTLDLPLTKEKDIEAALAFQVEPLLPYPTEQALLTYQVMRQHEEGVQLVAMAVRSDLLQAHLEQWQALKIIPEQVACQQVALAQFGQMYVKSERPYVVLHISDHAMICILTQEGKVLASYAHTEGLEGIYQAIQADEDLASIPFDQIDFNLEKSSLNAAIKRVQQVLHKFCYALLKQVKGEELEGILLTGHAALSPSLERKLTEKLNLNLLHCQEMEDLVSAHKQCYALPIGLALGPLIPAKPVINFRQQQWSYPNPWKRLRGPLLTYAGLMLGLAVGFYFFGQFYLKEKEAQLKQEYIELLASMNKSYENFETTFLAKNPLAREKFQGEIANIHELQQEDFSERLDFLQKDLQATPDSFPLFANIPHVSDVVAWLSQHPYVVYHHPDGTVEPRLQLESFQYTMLKRPVQGKKQEKYQVKVELEFSSPKPRWAREFHDALIVPNDFVDPKGEVKWSSNRGHYRTSFYLKDKTIYPNSA